MEQNNSAMLCLIGNTLTRLTQGLAHDINNKIFSISGCAQLLQQSSLTDQENEFVTTIIEQSNDITQLIGRLVNLTRSTREDTIGDSLSASLNNTVEALRASLPSRCELEADIPETLQWNQKSDTQLACVLLMLGLHSIEPHGAAKLTITVTQKTNGQIIIQLNAEGRETAFPEALINVASELLAPIGGALNTSTDAETKTTLMLELNTSTPHEPV